MRASDVLRLTGPGFIVMLAENDGPSMLSYAATGATYGIGFFIPFVVLTFALAYIVQELTVRLAIATKSGFARLVYERYGSWWGTVVLGDLAIGNAVTLVTEFIAIVAGASYFGIAPFIAVGATVATIVASFTIGRYRRWERLVAGLAAGNLVFIPAAIFAHPDPAAIARSFGSLVHVPVDGRPALFYALCLANIGASVTPWTIFFQHSAVVDKGLARADVPHARIDTALGAVLAAATAVAVLVAASPLFVHHIALATFRESTDFADALQPYLGRAGSTLFALGLIEAGLVAAITIATSSAYAIGDATRHGASLDLRFRDGSVFYLTGLLSVGLAAVVVLVPGAPLLTLALFVNVLSALVMPPALIFLLLLLNNRTIAGDLANGPLANVAGAAAIVAIGAACVAYGVAVVPQLIAR